MTMTHVALHVSMRSTCLLGWVGCKRRQLMANMWPLCSPATQALFIRLQQVVEPVIVDLTVAGGQGHTHPLPFSALHTDSSTPGAEVNGSRCAAT